MSFSAILAVYLLGGLTFIPLVLCIAFVHAYLTWPVREDTPSTADGATGSRDNSPQRQSKSLDSDFDSLPDELKTRAHVPDVAAGYFAVCREYVPGGINGKPPERTTPAGAVVASESPSVYQSMYRSIFDRNKSMSPTMDGTNGKSKKARNVFYVVLRLGLLMLYDDSEQLEVRHVISLAHYQVDIYAGGEAIPEGELWIKRNCIRLVQRSQLDQIISDSKPFYLFSENCSEKEDFYHAMLQSQEHHADSIGAQPRPLKFNTPDLVRLVQQLHASEENLHTRWINALLGRLFLAIYKTKEVDNFIWNKITKKIARVPKPALISNISLQKIDMGTLPPFITNPKLKELTVDGDLTVEADVNYKGNFRVEISAIARIELGARFKAREVTLVLASTLKKLEGHILVRMKPPPSNRLWVTFETAPKMELQVEPIVSARQITYGVILRAIESRIREVVSETLVYPNWDDIPFSDTILNQLRGGIWTDSEKEEISTKRRTAPVQQNASYGEKLSDDEDSDPQIPNTDGTKIARKGFISSVELGPDEATGFSSATDIKPPTVPKAMRSGSFASAASPIVNMSTTNASATKSELRERHQDAAAAMKITISRSQPTSPAESPVGSLNQPSDLGTAESRRSTSPAGFKPGHTEDDIGKLSSTVTLPNLSANSSDGPDSATGVSHSHSRQGSSLSLPRNAFASADKRQMFNQSLTTATAAAKKWFAARQNPDSPNSPAFRQQSPGLSPGLSPRPFEDNPENEPIPSPSVNHLSSSPNNEGHAPLGSPAHPIGRGQPLPPPGTPLPGPPKPEKKTTTGWSVPNASALANLTRRKPVAEKPQPSLQHQTHAAADAESNPEPARPPLPARTTSSASHFTHHHDSNKSVGTAAMGRRRKSSSVNSIPSSARRQRRSVTEVGSNGSRGYGGANEGLFVVEAPPTEVSAPPSPAFERSEKESRDVADARPASSKASSIKASSSKGPSREHSGDRRDRNHSGATAEGDIFGDMDIEPPPS